jgi:hypothetical protein
MGGMGKGKEQRLGLYPGHISSLIRDLSERGSIPIYQVHLIHETIIGHRKIIKETLERLGEIYFSNY